MSVEYRKIASAEPVAHYLSAIISQRLKDGQSVLWAVTGGSAISVAVQTSQLFDGIPLDKLTVMLSDERYGQPGHLDSNWKQLMDAGFQASNARLFPTLNGQDLVSTAQTSNQNLQIALQDTDFKVALLGMGPDGHVAGLLPGCPALKSTSLAAAYNDEEVSGDSPEGVKRGISRITMTIPAIIKMDEVIVYAMGEAKWPALDGLETDLPVETQPVQILKQVKRAIVFNDYKGEPV